MAEPNLLSPSSIKGMTAFIRQTSESILVLDNPIGSGKIFKINSLSKMPAQATNGSGPVYFFIVKDGNTFIYDRHVIGGGNAGVNRWTVINKNEMLYIQPGTALWSNDNGAGTPNPVDITISYEEIS